METLDELLASPEAVQGRRVFVRADLNVPLHQGEVADATRIRASLPTLRGLRDAGARLVVASHLGRPKGERRPELSLRPVAAALEAALGSSVTFADDCVGDAVSQAVEALAPGAVLLLENLRFYPGEERNDAAFARALASLADVYVNDAFGTAHRAHASTVGMVPHVARAVAGRLLIQEIRFLKRILEPESPFLCILGGAKVSDKLAVLEALAQRAEVLALGGAMAYTFLCARGIPVGSSRVEAERVDAARRTIRLVAEAEHRLLLPSDHVLARSLDDPRESRVAKEIPDGWMGVDIGPLTAAAYGEEARRARTIFWNGPMGVFEVNDFARGTEEVALAVADSKALSVVGGGDSLAAVNRAGVSDRISHLSTGGGASLEMIEGRSLPAVAALER